MALDLQPETFHSSPSAVLDFSSEHVYDLSVDSSRSQASVIGSEEDLIRHAHDDIYDDSESSPPILSGRTIDDYNTKRITIVHRPNETHSVEDAVDIRGPEGPECEQAVLADLSSVQASNEEHQQLLQSMPILTSNHLLSNSQNIQTTNNMVLLPATPQAPVVQCGGLQLSHQDLQLIQQQLQQRLLSQPITTTPPIHVNLPPHQYVILGTVNPNMQSQFVLSPHMQNFPTNATPVIQSTIPVLQPMSQLHHNSTINETDICSSGAEASTAATVSSTPTSKLTKAPNTIKNPSTHVKHQHIPDMIADLEELQTFAKHFKQRRVELGYTQGDVGSALGKCFPNDFSQTTISRFEASNLSPQNMRKLKPLVQRWLDDQQFMQIKTVSNTLADRISPEPAAADSKRRKKRTTIEDNVRGVLEVCFRLNPKPTAGDLTRIANEHNIERDVVRVWFCNRRQREKRLPKYLPTPNTPAYTIVNAANTNEPNIAMCEQQPPHNPQPPRTKISHTKTPAEEAAAAVLSAAMMSPQGATLRGYAQPIVFQNG